MSLVERINLLQASLNPSRQTDKPNYCTLSVHVYRGYGRVPTSFNIFIKMLNDVGMIVPKSRDLKYICRQHMRTVCRMTGDEGSI